MSQKYQYTRRLGGGGMAEVFLARTVGVEGFTRPVAIKRVLPSFSEDPAFSTMFVNEARLSAILRHPNIVQVLDFDRDDEARLYLVMELVEGKDLSDVASTGILPIPVVVHVITEVLKGLAHAHEMMTPDGKALGIVHRDISPHNVLVSWDGTVKVSDFGIAKAMLASGAGRSGMIKGKPLYMAPEQVTLPDDVDHRADLFAVGVMFFELLTGQRVYKGNSHEEVLTDVIQVARGWRQMVAPTSLRPDLPWDVAQVVMMLLAPDRQHRFSSARDAIDALHASASASPRGADQLSQVLYERFAKDAPPRASRRMASGSGVVAGPEGATWVVTPTGSAAQAIFAGGSARTPSVAAQMAQPTHTMQPPSGVATARLTGPSTLPEGTPAPTSRSRAPLIAAVLAAVALAAVLVVVLATRGGGASSKPAAVAPDAAKPAVDASVAPAIVDAAPPSLDAPSAAPDARRPDAGAGKPKHPPKPRGSGSGSGTDSTIHEVDLGGGN